MNKYDPKKVTLALGSHVASGFAEDSFISIEAVGDGVTLVTGCDGENAWSIDPSDAYTMTISLLQNSKTNDWLNNRLQMMKKSGNGFFSVNLKDIYGGQNFYTSEAAVVKVATIARGAKQTNREWQILCANGTYEG